MHILPFDNKNNPIVDMDDKHVPLNYFNIVKLNKDQSFEYVTPGYETCIVPATGTINVNIEGYEVKNLGTRTVDVWDGEPEGVYVPSGIKASFVALKDSEIFIAGAKFDKTFEPFAVRVDEIDKVQYGSDDTKTHRKIKHILGSKHHEKVGRLLCNELYTVGQGAGQVFLLINMILTDFQTKRATMKHIIIGFVLITDLVFNYFNKLMTRLERQST